MVSPLTIYSYHISFLSYMGLCSKGLQVPLGNSITGLINPAPAGAASLMTFDMTNEDPEAIRVDDLRDV